MPGKKRSRPIVTQAKKGRVTYSKEIKLVTVRATRVAQSMKSLINSIASGVEEKLMLEDSVIGMANEAEALISYLDYMPSAEKKRKLLYAYKKFLKAMIIDVDSLLSLRKINKR